MGKLDWYYGNWENLTQKYSGEWMAIGDNFAIFNPSLTELLDVAKKTEMVFPLIMKIPKTLH